MKDIIHKESSDILRSEMLNRFDREYSLNDLLIKEDLKTIQDKIDGFGIDFFAVLFPDGKPFFFSKQFEGKELKILSEYMKDPKNLSEQSPDFLNKNIKCIPLEHEFETLGYLLFVYDKEISKYPFSIQNIISLIHKMIMQKIELNYKVQLTSNLHGQVVEESHAELRNRAELLEQSEQKYKNLAENLDEEVKKKTNKIKEAQTQLMHQDKMASIGQLAAGVAHEINNPIGFISSNLNTLKEYSNDLIRFIQKCRELNEMVSGLDEDIAAKSGLSGLIEKIQSMDKKIDLDFILDDIPSLLEESSEGANRVKAIVQDLKDFAHPGAEIAAYSDIHQNIDSTLNIVWSELKYKAEVIKDYGELPYINCYPRQLNQVFMNILVNAAHAIEDKGQIKIITRPLDDQIEVIISDTGQGIAEENMLKIFDPFFTTKEVGKGTGLGLNLVYNIIQKHKGSIHVKSKVGKGTEFIIKLPVNSKI